MAPMPRITATTIDEYTAALPAALVRRLVKAQIARRAGARRRKAGRAGRAKP